MTDSKPGAQVLPFPIQPRNVDRAARRAVAHLTYAQLISEAEAVRALEGLDATDEIRAGD